ncbi:MAG: DUF5335 family protein [Candidatus Sericytochromatia bacterium]|nr:DUF5335 family protein [Candidatus Sericytochromatia bacterium]
MATYEIPKEHWQDFLCTVGNRRSQQPVSIQVTGENLGSQTLCEHLPLVGLSLEEKGSLRAGIEVTLEAGEGAFTHLVAEPTALFVQEDEGGRVHSLDIQDTAQIKTLIFFEEPVAADEEGLPVVSEMD